MNILPYLVKETLKRWLKLGISRWWDYLHGLNLITCVCKIWEPILAESELQCWEESLRNGSWEGFSAHCWFQDVGTYVEGLKRGQGGPLTNIQQGDRDHSHSCGGLTSANTQMNKEGTCPRAYGAECSMPTTPWFWSSENSTRLQIYRIAK